MFPTRYFADRYFAPRYFPKVGAEPPTFMLGAGEGRNDIVPGGMPQVHPRFITFRNCMVLHKDNPGVVQYTVIYRETPL